VNDSLRASGGEAFRDLARDPHDLARRGRPRVEQLPERLSFEELRDGVRDAVIVAEVVDREDVRVREPPDRLCLPLETSQCVRILRDRGR